MGDVDDLVTIVMPMYNAREYIEETLGSIQAQTYPTWKLVVVDDGSDDGSRQIVEAAARQDSRICLLRKPAHIGRGALEGRNYGLAHVEGRWLAFMDADDLWEPAKLETQIRAMEAVGIPASIHSYWTIEGDGAVRNRVRVRGVISYKRYLCNTVTSSSTWMSDNRVVPPETYVITELSGMDIGDDLAMWIRYFQRFGRIYGVEEPLARYRRHPSSRSSNLLRAARRSWRTYRLVGQMNVATALVLSIAKNVNAVRRRLPMIGARRQFKA